MTESALMFLLSFTVFVFSPCLLRRQFETTSEFISAIVAVYCKGGWGESVIASYWRRLILLKTLKPRVHQSSGGLGRDKKIFFLKKFTTKIINDHNNDNNNFKKSRIFLRRNSEYEMLYIFPRDHFRQKKWIYLWYKSLQNSRACGIST